MIATKTLKVTPNIISSAGLSDESVTIVYVECKGEVSYENQEDSESIEVSMFYPEQLSELLCNTKLAIGAKAYLIMAEIGRHGIGWLYKE